jgi:hypothetical protein
MLCSLVVVSTADDLLHGGSNQNGLKYVSHYYKHTGIPGFTYMLKLSGVRALLVTQGRVRFDDTSVDQVVELQES